MQAPDAARNPLEAALGLIATSSTSNSPMLSQAEAATPKDGFSQVPVTI